MKSGWVGFLGLVLCRQACADPDSLWHVVDAQCVPHQMEQGTPEPCTQVELGAGRERGFVVLKDKVGPLQYLVMPTIKVQGIESAALLAENSPAYWEKAWEARHFMSQKLDREVPRSAVALAVNSRFGRGQNQFHIHVSCVDLQVHEQLEIVRDFIPAKRWQALPVTLAGHRYLARRVDAGAGDTVGVNPFRLLADGIPGARAEMGHYTLGMVATRFSDGRNGFIILADKEDIVREDAAQAEELQDHACAILGREEKTR